MSSFRPIRPKGGDTESQSPGTGPSTPNEPGPSTGVHRPKVATACKPCRARKARCNGQRPTCDTCSQRNLNCEYPPPPPDEEMIKDQQKLLEVLRTAPEPVAEEALRHIRSGMQPGAILQVVDETPAVPALSPTTQHPLVLSPPTISPADMGSTMQITNPFIDLPPLSTSDNDRDLAVAGFSDLNSDPVPSGWKGDPALLSKTLSDEKSSSGDSGQGK